MHRLLTLGILGLCFAVLFLAPLPSVHAEATAVEPVARGTLAEEVRSRLGEPQETQVVEAVPEGPQILKWKYAGGLIVVIQEGIVIDSFTAEK